ncbi:hypothetical protein VNO77_00820 [Canavalia gladiata]|uniref:Uncharacterized protein n=1 Tax=Canavalia gladiata TaxID=3824 RepID=A0AAN9R1N7_CANGL
MLSNTLQNAPSSPPTLTPLVKSLLAPTQNLPTTHSIHSPSTESLFQYATEPHRVLVGAKAPFGFDENFVQKKCYEMVRRKTWSAR